MQQLPYTTLFYHDAPAFPQAYRQERSEAMNPNKASLAYIVFLRYDVIVSETNRELQERESTKQKQERKRNIIFSNISNSNNRML